MLDKDAYRRGVLEPARAQGNRAPADLLARYALRPSAPVQGAALEEHLAEVTAYWRTLKQQKKVYAKLIDALLIGHGELDRAGMLTWDGLTDETRRRATQATARLRAAVATLAGTSISRAAVDHLVADSGGVCAESDVRKMLAEHNVVVIERSWELPSGTPPPAYQMLRTALGQLGLRLSAEAVVGTDTVRRGFTLRDGFRLTTASPVGAAGPLTEDAINEVIRRSAGRARDEGKAATDSVLSTLVEAARKPERLDALVLWEVMEVLRPHAEAGLPAKLLAEQARDLGLVRDEAEELALAMLARDTRPAGVASRLEEALLDGRLRAAELLLPGLPADARPELRAQVEEKGRQVAEWTAAATREHAAGRSEAAAELLDRAWRVAADDETIGDRLHALPPPPPGDVRVGVERDRVTVAWTPSPARVGPVRYRVVRTTGTPARGTAGGTSIGETDSNELIDPAPPAAEELYYSAFAGRAEGIWSTPAVGGPVTVLPEIDDPSVMAGETEVAATWRLPPAATGAVVTRLGADGGTPQRADQPRVERGGFVDTGVTPGRRYRYRIQAAYEGRDGTRRLSRGVIVTGLPEGPPQAVSTLEVEVDPDGVPGAAAGTRQPVARITWTEPAGGRVLIRTSDARPPWPPGTRLPQDDVARYGQEVPGAAVRGADGRTTLRAPVSGAARGYFVAVTLAAGTAIVGASAAFALVEPVRQLTAHRLGDTVALSWIWPPEAQRAEVTWAPAAPADAGPAGSASGTGTSTGSAQSAQAPDEWVSAVTEECRRRAYEDEGYRLRVGTGAVLVSVRTVVSDGDGTLRSRPIVTAVPATGATVRYQFGRPLLARRRAATAVLTLTADQRCRLPPLVVVHRAGGLVPLRPEQGEVIHTVPAGDLDPDHPRTLRIKVPAARDGSRLACFPAPEATGPEATGSEATPAVTLIQLPGSW